MQRILLLACAAALALGASACAVHTKSGSVIVDPKGVDSKPGGGPPTNERGEFCPPGQKKKGRC
jgi:hypothetical protein